LRKKNKVHFLGRIFIVLIFVYQDYTGQGSDFISACPKMAMKALE
jgi:hypothetical protein